MSRRVIRTTRKVMVNEDEPIETVHAREVDRALRDGSDLQVYEAVDQVQPAEYLRGEPVVPATRRELAVHDPWLRALQNLNDRELAVWREFDRRVTRLEEWYSAPATPSFERATWWALWGLLMLVLGASLVVIVFLIFSSYF